MLLLIIPSAQVPLSGALAMPGSPQETEGEIRGGFAEGFSRGLDGLHGLGFPSRFSPRYDYFYLALCAMIGVLPLLAPVSSITAAAKPKRTLEF